MRGRIVIIDDEAALADAFALGLRSRGFDVETASDASAFLARIRDVEADVIVTDLRMPGVDGIDLCRQVAEARPDLPVLVMTAFGSLDAAVAAIRAGAYDFLVKPLEIDVLEIAVSRAVQHRSLREELKRLRHKLEPAAFGEIVGESEGIRALIDLLERVSDSDANILIDGESGTGKELVAKAIHARSRRKAGPFVAVNCAAVPETLIESELFGHAKGAFTDAGAPQKGLFLQAHGGTLFLDEIGELSQAVQPKLLRALQERKVRAVGATQEVEFDARIVTATNRDLEGMVEEGRFREDLLFRLNVVGVRVPPLRSRGNDVLLLAHRFVAQFSARAGRSVKGLSPPAAERLLAYAWPGNVRELQNAMERAIALTRHEEIGVDDLPDKIRNFRSSHVVVAAENPSELVSLEELERRYILRVLEAAGGNKTEAARILGLDRKTLYRKLDRWNPPT